MAKYIKSLTLVALLLLAAASSARADQTWDFTYTGATATDTSSGTLTTTDLSGGTATIIGISGTWNGAAITGLLAPGTCCSTLPNDNILYFPGPPFLDVAGLGFSTALGILDSNVYFSGSSAGGYSDLVAPSNQVGNLTLVSSGAFTVTPAPEPASIFLLGSGLLGVFLARKKKHA